MLAHTLFSSRPLQADAHALPVRMTGVAIFILQLQRCAGQQQATLSLLSIGHCQALTLRVRGQHQLRGRPSKYLRRRQLSLFGMHCARIDWMHSPQSTLRNRVQD